MLSQAHRTLRQDILTDCLGLFVPRLSLSARYGPCPSYPACNHQTPNYCRHPQEWYLEGASEQLGRGWPTWTTLDAARRDLLAAGYVVSAEPVNLAGDYSVTHPPTQTALDRSIAADATKWQQAIPCYVRYGRLPPGGRSRNHADGSPEAGVSVFRGQRLPTGEARALPCNHLLFADMLFLQARPLYIVTGTEIGTGSDGEPLLAEARIWRRASARGFD